jgi:AcrR family transcriptional regulator
MGGGSRGGQPRASVWLGGKAKVKAKEGAGELGLERIVAATIGLLDAEGLAKFSMRRLAAVLGVTAMSVYWYVDTKDELLERALDEVSGSMALPDVDDETADWRDQLRTIAVEYRNMLSAHPWVTQLVGQYLNIGPRSMAFAEASLRVIARSGISKEGTTGALAALFQFVYGFATIEALYKERCRAAGLGMDEYFQQVMDVFTVGEEFGDAYKAAAEVIRSTGAESVAEMRERDFAFALDTVIAGIEAMTTA